MQINVKNAVWCLNMKDFSLFGSESKEGLKNIESTYDRTVNLFRPEVKISLQMNGVKNNQGLY